MTKNLKLLKVFIIKMLCCSRMYSGK